MELKYKKNDYIKFRCINWDHSDLIADFFLEFSRILSEKREMPAKWAFFRIFDYFSPNLYAYVSFFIVNQNNLFSNLF